MKTLYLVRHAKANKGKSNSPNSKRSLTKKGKNDAAKMAKKIKRNGVIPDVLISSPAKQAIQTAQIFAKTINYPKDKIIRSGSIDEGTESSENLLMQSVHEIDDQNQSAMIFGHAPLLAEFAQYLRKDFTETLPTCGVVCLDFPNVFWSKISKGRGIIKFFDYPKKQKKLKAAMKKDLESKVIDSMTQTLSEMNADVAQRMKKSVKKSGKELSQRFVAVFKSMQVDGNRHKSTPTKKNR